MLTLTSQVASELPAVLKLVIWCLPTLQRQWSSAAICFYCLHHRITGSHQPEFFQSYPHHPIPVTIYSRFNRYIYNSSSNYHTSKMFYKQLPYLDPRATPLDAVTEPRFKKMRSSGLSRSEESEESERSERCRSPWSRRDGSWKILAPSASRGPVPACAALKKALGWHGNAWTIWTCMFRP